jgi:hypothetical protein
MTPNLFHDSLTDALNDTVKALGGHKVVGAALKPEKSPEAAGRWLHDCLNPNRPERLEPDQVLFILREGRKHNAHEAINYLLRESGYADAVPIEPEDERARLQREFINAVAVVQQLGKRLGAA